MDHTTTPSISTGSQFNHTTFTEAPGGRGSEPEMKVTSWVVMIHSPGVGTYAPTFPNIDDAEDFANGLRILTDDDTAISEPIPVVKTVEIKAEPAIRYIFTKKDYPVA